MYNNQYLCVLYVLFKITTLLLQTGVESFKALYGYYEAAGGLCDFLFLLREQ